MKFHVLVSLNVGDRSYSTIHVNICMKEAQNAWSDPDLDDQGSKNL